MADLPCPNCGSPLAFLDQYQRHYCTQCGQYAPEGYGDHGGKHCPTCGGILSFVSRYDRFYCYHCNLYAPDQVTPPAAAPTPQPASPPAPAPSAPATAAPAAILPTPDATLVATTAPEAETKPTATVPEPSPAPEAQPEPTPAAPEAAAPATPEVAAASPPPEPVPSEPSPAIQKLATSKPAVVRVKIFTLKKSELIDLCKTYSLDPSGTKEQIQERLLSYLHSLEAEESPEEEPQAPSAALATETANAPIPEAKLEPEAYRPPAASLAGSATTAAVIQVERPQPAAATEARVEQGPPTAVEVSRAPPSIEHPCPTCGRELTFISQYDRYYCYFCQRYAPAARAKGACPTCGASMRWIDPHQRWWCDSCQKYASADLPKPTNGAVAVARTAAAATTVAVARPAAVVHRHASPALGMGLIGLGLVLWVIVEFFSVLAPAMSLSINDPFTDGLGPVTVFFAFIFVAAGALLGLSSLRDRL